MSLLSCLKSNKIILAVIVAIVAFGVWYFVIRKSELFEEDYEDQIEEEDFFDDEEEPEMYEETEPVDEIEGYEDVAEQKKVPATKDETLQKGLEARKQLKPEQLLPKDNEAGAWSKVNPKGKGSLAFKNFIDAGYHLGINTVGQSLRNANLQIRSEPSNPQVPVSIWQNSTISPDANRRDFEVGCKSTQ